MVPIFGPNAEPITTVGLLLRSPFRPLHSRGGRSLEEPRAEQRVEKAPFREYDRGRKGALDCAPPPSEPYGRFSRIRLSGRWFTSRGLTRLGMGLFQTEQPLLGKVGVGPALMVSSLGRPLRLLRFRRMLRRRPRTHPSRFGNVVSMAVFEVLKPAAQGSVDVRE